MNLAFTTKWPNTMPDHLAGQPTNFQVKIWKSFPEPLQVKHIRCYSPFSIKNIFNEKAKLHTIREDKKNRWKPGTDIHFIINNRTPQRYQFAPILKCVSTQKFEIFWQDLDLYPLAIPQVYVDGVWLIGQQLQNLAINDGFNCLDDFFLYFNKNFTGKIIHWTNFKY